MTSKSHGETERAVSEARYVAAIGRKRLWRFGHAGCSSANQLGSPTNNCLGILMAIQFRFTYYARTDSMGSVSFPEDGYAILAMKALPASHEFNDRL